MTHALQVESISKCFRISVGDINRPTNLRETLAYWTHGVWHRLRHGAAHSAHSEDFWALRDVSFDLPTGTALGLVGANGAGKSTLLKILSRIVEPTSGRALIRGRVASLLEVGTGFHPELTGRENVFLNGTILGMRRRQIRDQLDAIIDFSGIDKFMDTPVKRYSSGMRVRLAFAVAAHLEPEVLVIDEVLAVGDATFQRKCLGKMQDVSRHGRTVLFVSHNMTAVQSFCQRVIWLKNGCIAGDGTPEEIVPRYLEVSEGGATVREWKESAIRPATNEAALHRVAVVSETGNGVFAMNQPLQIEIDYEVFDDSHIVDVTAILHTAIGAPVFTTSTFYGDEPRKRRGMHRAVCQIPANLLAGEWYVVSVQVMLDRSRAIISQPSVASFQVLEVGSRGYGWQGKDAGVVAPRLPWTVEPLR